MDDYIKPAYFWLSIALYISYFVAYIGVYYVEPSYIELLSRTIRLLVCGFLVVRFHPFRKTYAFQSDDARLIFASAVLLLTDLGITQLILDNTVKKII